MQAPRSLSVGGNADNRGATVLSMWFFKFAQGDDLGITLQGYKCTDSFGTNLVNWGSSPIVRRINATTLATKSNSQYKLMGPISERECRELGLPLSLIALFQYGFPENWMTILRAYWNKLRETNPLNASQWFDKTSHLYEGNTVNHDVSQINPRPSMARKSILPPPNTAPSPLVEESESVINTPIPARGTTKPRARSSTKSPHKRPCTSQKPLLPPSNSVQESEKENSSEQTTSATEATNGRQSRDRSRSISASPTNDAAPRRSPRLSNPTSRVASDKKAKPDALVIRQRSSTVDSGLMKKTLFTPAPIGKMKRAISDNKMNHQAKTEEAKKNEKPSTILKNNINPSKSSKSNGEVDKQKRKSVVTISSPAVTGVADIDPGSPERSPPKEFVAPTPETRGAGKRTSRLSSTDTNGLPHMDNAVDDFPAVNIITHRPSMNRLDSSDRPSTSRDRCISDGFDSNSNTGPKWESVAQTLKQWCVVFLGEQPVNSMRLPEMGHPLFSITGYPEDATPDTPAWGTSPIIDVRLSSDGSPSNLLMTSSKKIYKLVGDMDRNYAHKHGFSKKFLKLFRRGFPSNWKELLLDEKRRGPTNTSHENRNIDDTRMVDLTRMSSAPVITHPDDEVNMVARTDFPNVPHLLPDDQPLFNSDNSQIVAVSTTTRTATIAKRRSSHGRPLREPWGGEHVHQFDNRLAFEKDGKKRKTVKRKMDTYSAGSDDEELLVRNVRLAIEAPKYFDDSDMPMRGRYQQRRDREVFSDSEDEQNHIEQKILEIQREKKKLRQQLRKLEGQELKLEEEALEIRKRRNRLRKIRQQKARYDEEDGYSRYPPMKALKPPPAKKSKPSSHHYKKKQLVRCDSDDSDFFTLDKDERDNRYSSSTETECSDGGDWRRGNKSKHVKQNVAVVKTKNKSSTKKPTAAPKKQDKKKKSREPYADSDQDVFQDDEQEIDYETSDLSSGDDSDEYVEPVNERKKATAWRREDVDKLKRALDAIVIKKDSDWEKISRSMGNTWTPEECRETAIKKLKWMPRDQLVVAEPVMEVTSKKGTFKYAKETQQQLRGYMVNGGSQGDDYFGNRDRITSVELEDTLGEAADELMEVNLDNSLLAAMKTPTVINKKVARRSEFFPDENTPSTSNDRDGTSDERIRESPVVDLDRDQQTKYLHYLTHNRSNLSTRVNNSTFMNQNDAEKTLAAVTSRVDEIKKKTKLATKKNRRLTEYEEDDEENEENDMFS